MTWFKVDDCFHSHPKVLACSLAAVGLWVRAGSWCGQHEGSRGVVPRALLSTFGAKLRHAQELCEAGLWTELDQNPDAGGKNPASGWRFHEWEIYQPSPEVLATKRAKNTAKLRDWRERNPSRNQVTDQVTNQVSNPAPDPTRPDPIRKEESAREEQPLSIQHQLRIGFTKRLERENQTHPNQKALGGAVQQLVPWIENTAPLRKLAESELLTRLLDGFFANENARTKGFPPAFLANNPSEYLDARPQLRAARSPEGIPPVRNYGPREETG